MVKDMMIIMSDQDRRSSRHVLQWFLGFTTIGGLSQHSATDWKASKVVWALLFCFGTFLTLWNVNQVLEDYQANHIITTITRAHQSAVKFPSVTICNVNKVHCDNLYRHIGLRNQTSGNEKLVAVLCAIFTLGKCQASLKINDLFTQGRPLHPEICLSHYVPGMWKDYPGTTDEALFLLDYLVDQLPTNDAMAIGHQVGQMVKKCSYQGVPDHPACKQLVSGVAQYQTNQAGLCFAFNYLPSFIPHNMTFDASLTAALSGDAFGLDLELNIESGLSLNNGLSRNAGVQVVIHNNDMYPLTASEGIMLRPNTLTQIALEEVRILRQPPPYTSMCRSSWDGIKTKMPFPGMPYNDKLCQSFCIDDYIQRLCNCTITSVIEMNRDLSETCVRSNVDHSKCIDYLISNADSVMDVAAKGCSHCTPQCQETDHTMTISTATWPSPRYWMVLADKHNVTFNGTKVTEDQWFQLLSVGSNLDQLMNVNTVLNRIEQSIREDFLRVQIFFNSKTVTSITELPKYHGFSALFTSLGGTLSLYLGISVVSLFEIVELVVRSFYKLLNLSKFFH